MQKNNKNPFTIDKEERHEFAAAAYLITGLRIGVSGKTDNTGTTRIYTASEHKEILLPFTVRGLIQSVLPLSDSLLIVTFTGRKELHVKFTDGDAPTLTFTVIFEGEYGEEVEAHHVVNLNDLNPGIKSDNEEVGA